MSDQDAVAVSKKFVSAVKKVYPVEKAYLFGSFAKNKFNEASDIDVCVVSPVFGKNYLEEEMKLIGMSVKIDSRISPVPLSSVDINDKWSQLAHEITTHGIQI